MGLNRQKIVLITSGQPSLNPRLVKEADALVEVGYEVTVIYQYWNEWGTDLDKELLPLKKWKNIRVGGDPVKEKATYWWSRIKLKIGQKLVSLLGFNYNLAELSIGRCTFELLNEAKRNEATLYIAHNLAALPAAVAAAQKFKVKSGFDAEDFHRYEMSDHDQNPDVQLKKYIEDRYFPLTDYLTTSSPEIAKRYEALYPRLKFTTLLNVFPNTTFTSTYSRGRLKPLKLFWFSQNVGLSRGLQDVIAAIKLLEDETIEFHILGFLSAQVKIELDQLIVEHHFTKQPNIIFHQPIASTELANFASQFDIGLATEPGFSINNDIALSNKIFTYTQAGLAIIASDTTAQKSFMIAYPDMGFVYQKKNPTSLAQALKPYLTDINLLERHQVQSAIYAKEKLNWEMEKEKFIFIIERLLSA